MTQPFEVAISAVVEASVTHVAPCVAECPVCYPLEESED
jgi:hypothetical protein